MAERAGNSDLEKQSQRAATAAAPTAANAETAMGETRANVTRHRRAAMRAAKGENAAGPQVDIPEGGGRGLAGGVKSTMEKKLGADLSQVKIHTGGGSEDASAKLNARAFTVGNDVHFNSGEFNPDSKEGTKLLAHELTHVVQGQKGGVQKKEEEGGGEAEGKDGEALAVSDPEEPAEKEADAVADQATADVGEAGIGDKGAGGGDDDKGEAKDAGGGKQAKAKGDGEGGGDKGEATEEKAPEAGAKLQSPISAKYTSSALRSVLRKTAYRAEDEEKKDEAPAEPEAKADEKDAGKGDGKLDDKDSGSGGGEEKAEAKGDGADAKLDDKDGGEAAGNEAKKPEAEAKAKDDGDSDGGPGLADKDGEEKVAGGEAGADEKTGEAPTTVAAKLKGVHRKIFRAGSAPADPWQTFCGSLPANLKPLALPLTAEEQQPFKDVGAANYQTFLKLQSKPARIEMAGLDNNAKGKLAALVQAEADRLTYENTLSGAPRGIYRDLTPDERKAMAVLSHSDLPALLGDAAKLNEWRALRNVEELKTNDRVVADLTIAGENPEEIVKALSAGRAGERLNRVLRDPGFANEGTKAQFIVAVKKELTTAGDSFAAMAKVQKDFVLKGKSAAGDPKFNEIPIMKAFPLVNMWKYGTVGDDVMASVIEANPPAGIPKLPNGKIDRAAALTKVKSDDAMKASLAPAFARCAKASGSIAGSDLALTGRGVPTAYWTYDDAGRAMLQPDKSSGDVSKILAVDENPDYQLGFAVVSLPDPIKQQYARDANICRPTAVDGLHFDQFATANADACYGVTSGGMNEVVIPGIKVSQTKVERIC